jgi:hypothetical protein
MRLLVQNAHCTLNDVQMLLYITAVLLCVVVVIINIFPLIAIIKSRKLRTPTNIILLNLVLLDLLLGTTAPYTYIMNILIVIAIKQYNQEQLRLYLEIRSNKALCLLLDGPGLIYACMMASIFTLLAVAFEKYLAIFNPLRYNQLITIRKIILGLSVIWLVTLLFGFLPLIGWNNYNSDEICLFVAKTDFNYLITWASLCLASALITLILYLRIFIIARKHSRQIFHPSVNNQPKDNLPCPKMYRTPTKAVKTIAIILGTFYICWLPLLIYLLAYSTKYSDLIIYALSVLALANSILNPVVYALRTKPMRLVIEEICTIC